MDATVIGPVGKTGQWVLNPPPHRDFKLVTIDDGKWLASGLLSTVKDFVE